MNVLFVLVFVVAAYQMLMVCVHGLSEATSGTKHFGNTLFPLGAAIVSLVGSLVFFFRYFVHVDEVSVGPIMTAGVVGIIAKMVRGCLNMRGVEADDYPIR